MTRSPKKRDVTTVAFAWFRGRSAIIILKS
jgi:hypothetical protein